MSQQNWRDLRTAELYGEHIVGTAKWISMGRELDPEVNSMEAAASKFGGRPKSLLDM